MMQEGKKSTNKFNSWDRMKEWCHSRCWAWTYQEWTTSLEHPHKYKPSLLHVDPSLYYHGLDNHRKFPYISKEYTALCFLRVMSWWCGLTLMDVVTLFGLLISCLVIEESAGFSEWRCDGSNPRSHVFPCCLSIESIWFTFWFCESYMYLYTSWK